MKLTVDIIDDFIQSLDLSGDVRSFSDDGTDTTLIVDNTFHARDGMILDIDGLPFTIVSIVFGISITVSGLPAAPFNYTVPLPFYFHGTPIATNNQISEANHADKVPMIYLHEILKEKDKDIFSSVKRDSDVRFFFLDSANFSDWSTDDHYSQVLLGLNALVDAFESQALKSRLFFLDETEFSRVNHVNWGTVQDSKGHIKNIFDDKLTGVELSLTLPLKDCEDKVFTPRLPCPDVEGLQPAWDGSSDPEKNTFVDDNSFEIITFLKDSVNASAVLARMTALVIAEEAAISKFVTNLGGFWNDNIDEFANYRLQLESNSLIGWKLKTQDAINAPPHTPGQGFAMNGIDQEIITNYNPATDGINFALDDAVVGINTVSEVGLSTYFKNASRSIELRSTGVPAYKYRLNQSGSDAETRRTTPAGLKIVSRVSSIGSEIFQDGATSAPLTNRASVAVDSENIIISPSGGFEGVIDAFVVGGGVGFGHCEFFTHLVILNTELAAI